MCVDKIFHNRHKRNGLRVLICVWFFVQTGGDDRRVLLWKLEEAMGGIGEPKAMKNQHYSNIFCLSFNNDSTKIFSGGNDDSVIVHDTNT